MGRSALILGATGGLGSAIARDLAERGVRLTLVGRDSDRLAELDVDGHRQALDLRLPASCEAAVDAAVRHGDGLDIVVNAVGVVAFGSVTDLSVDAMEELFLTNTFLSIMLAQSALPQLSEGGVLVNIPGVVAERNVAGMAAYGASKAAVRAFDEALAKEARRTKIRILDARPPHTETGLADRPIEGTAPKMPTGLDPTDVARVICDAIVDGETTELPSDAFG